MNLMPLLDISVDFYQETLNRAIVASIIFIGIIVISTLTICFIKRNKDKDKKE
jgi:hypothetical protein